MVHWYSCKSQTDASMIAAVGCWLQIYNEEVNDLLAPESVKLPVHESKENGPYVCGLREDIVTSPEQVPASIASAAARVDPITRHKYYHLAMIYLPI